jgi:hypothetical protein
MTNPKIKINLDSLKSRKEWKRHKVKDGHNVFRILPPFGEASNGYPYRKWQIIWGLVDPESGRARPYADTMLAEKRSPVVEFTNELKARAEKMNLALAAKGLGEEEISERLKGLNTLIGDLLPRTSYVYNACDKAGEVGLLELKATAHKDMKARMNEYIQDYNQDPTSLNSADDDSGLWFDVVRTNETGKFRDTKYEVKKVQTKVRGATGAVSFVDDRSPLPEAVVENYDNLGYDLSAIYQQKTYEELKEILDANLPRLFELCPDADLSVEPSLSATPVETVAKTTTRTAPAATVAKPATATKVAIKLDDEDDEAPVAAPAAPRTVTRPTTPTATVTVATDESDDFMAEADRILNS